VSVRSTTPEGFGAGAAGFGRLGRRSGRRCALGGRRDNHGGGGLGLAVAARDAALLDLHDHLFAAAMAEALPHHAGFGARLERQRL
jgi:hypothetical protein